MTGPEHAQAAEASFGNANNAAEAGDWTSARTALRFAQAQALIAIAKELGSLRNLYSRRGPA